MRIKVKVKPSAKQNKIEERDGIYFIWVKEKAEKGKANKKLIELLSEYFKVPKSNVEIKTGERSRNKIIEILKDENE